MGDIVRGRGESCKGDEIARFVSLENDWVALLVGGGQVGSSKTAVSPLICIHIN